MKNLLIFCVFFLANAVSAGTIIIDPDDYDAGTDLTSISPHTTITTTDGAAVNAASLSAVAADGKNTQGLGQKVFGGGGWSDEWFYLPASSPGLEIKFNIAVTHCSLLVAELFWDAGPGSDPVLAYVFDTNDNLLSQFYVDEYHDRVDLGFIVDGMEMTWAYWTFEYSAANIGKIIIGGDSEPTTLDRLEFTYADYTEVSEPGSLVLILIGFIFFLLLRYFPSKTTQF